MTNASLWILSFLPCLYQYAGFLPFTFIIGKSVAGLLQLKKSIDYPINNYSQLIVPNVIGNGVQASQKILGDCGFLNIKVSVSDTTYSPSNQQLYVVENQSIVPGSHAAESDEIVLFCKKAKIITCLDVRNLTLEYAKEKLNDIGITHIVSNIDDTELIGDEIEDWLVAEQSVQPNQDTYEYTEVFLNCEKGKHFNFIIESDGYWTDGIPIISSIWDGINGTSPIDIYIDDSYIDTVHKGERISGVQPLLCGQHSIKAVKCSDSGVYDERSFYISDDYTWKASISHDHNVSFYAIS